VINISRKESGRHKRREGERKEEENPTAKD